MITALISTVLGLVGGVVPDVLKEWTASREHDREMERMDKQAEIQVKLQQAQTDGKLAEIEGNSVVEEVKAFADQMKAIYAQQAPIGVHWVDAWNACIRPGACTMILVVFATGILMHMTATILLWWHGTVDMMTATDMLFNGLAGEAIQAVMGYLFGYRTSSLAIQTVRRPVAGLPWLKK